MPRARMGAASHRRKRRTLNDAKGYRSARSKCFRLAKEAVIRAGVYAFRDRRRRKRDFRSLWITRLTAACEARGIKYSRLIRGLQHARIELNRKMLSEIAIHAPADFDAIVEAVRKHLPKDRAVA